MTSTVRSHTLNMVYAAMFAVIMAICSWIAIPGPVPFTLQTFAVFVTIAMLGGKRASVSILLYILLGAIGVPVFANFKGGISVLLGPTGGYIIGFMLIALLNWLLTHLFGKKLLITALSMTGGLLLCYAFGTAQFMLVTQSGGNPYTLGAALWMCVLPFVPIDLIKMALALFLSARLSRIVHL